MTGAFIDLMQWFSKGKLKYREDIMEGLEYAPRAINKLFEGLNNGTLLIKIVEESIFYFTPFNLSFIVYSSGTTFTIKLFT